MTDRRIEYMSISEIRPAEKNVKDHDLGELNKSIHRFGYVEPLQLDERTQRLVAGHGRLETLQQMKAAKTAPPEGVAVRIADSEWLVPVARGWASKDDTEAKAYLIASNRLVEPGGWDEKARDDLLIELSKGGEEVLRGIGYDADDIDLILRKQLPESAEEIPEVPAKAWVKRGDLFRLGDHRLLCGDSTDAKDVARLMADESAGLMNTDPPYGVAYDNASRPNPGVGKPRTAKDEIANDALSENQLEAFLIAAFRPAVQALSVGAAWYIWHAALRSRAFQNAMETVGVKLRRQIIWKKQQLIIGRGQYHWIHEPCWMGWSKKVPPDFGRGAGERDQTTVWDSIPALPQADRAEFQHATPKPVALFEIPLIKHLKVDEVAYEPFAGTGPQVIAAEHLNRRCFAMELEPRYCQVIITRWEKFSGQKAKKL